MTAEEIRTERNKYIEWFDVFKSSAALLENLCFMQLITELEIAAQLAEVNEHIRKGRLSPVLISKEGSR